MMLIVNHTLASELNPLEVASEKTSVVEEVPAQVETPKLKTAPNIENDEKGPENVVAVYLEEKYWNFEGWVIYTSQRLCRSFKTQFLSPKFIFF